jgi:hypothetical protein
MRRRAVLVVTTIVAAAVAALFVLRSRTDDATTTDSGASVETAGPVGSQPPKPVAAPALAAHGTAKGVDDAKPSGSVADARRGGKTTSARTVNVTGRVVREKNVPSAGAKVEAHADAKTVVEATAADDGTFALEIDRPDDDASAGVLVARDTEGRVGFVALVWRPMPHEGAGGPKTSIDVHDVFVRKAASLDVVVRDAAGFAVAADVAVGVAWVASSTPIARARTDEAGRARIDVASPGTFAVAAMAAGRGRGVTMVDLPRDGAEPLEIKLVPLRDVDVTVVEKGSETPIAGARVTLIELVMTGQTGWEVPYLFTPDAPATDAQGRTRLVGIASAGSLRVIAVAPGYLDAGSATSDSGGVRLAPDATTLVVPMSRRRRVSWEVEPGDAPTPPDGATLSLRPQVGSGTTDLPPTGRMEGGKIVVDDVTPAYFSAIAVAPDGSQARLWVKPDTLDGTPTKFSKTPRAEVVVRWNDGAPAAGLFVELRNQGNNPFGPAVETDANGKAVFEGLEQQMADVYVSMSKGLYSGRRVATTDLGKGEGRVEVTIPRLRDALIRVFLDGTPGLPKTLWASPQFAMPSSMNVESRDEAAGTARVKFWPAAGGGDTVIPLEVAGWIIDGPLKIPASAPDPIELRIDLRRSGSLDVEVVPPPDGRFALRAERFDPEKNEWLASGHDTQLHRPGQGQVDAQNHWRLQTLAPGRYRVREPSSSSLSDEVEVVARPEPATLRFDLSRVGWASGRVVVPAGESAAGITVRLDPAPPAAMWGQESGVRTGPEGTFKIRLPGDRDVTLTAESMLLMPAKDGGRVHAIAGAQGLEIRLVRGPVVHVTFDRAPPYWINPGEVHTESVYLWRGPMAGPPTISKKAKIEGATATFGGIEPGRWSVMIDLMPVAPVVVENVEIGEGETSVGPVALSDGTSLQFEVRVPAGQTAPRISVWARRLDVLPSYQRWGEVGAKGKIPGLRRGRFHVSAHPVMGGGALFDKDIDVDGATDVPLVLDLK